MHRPVQDIGRRRPVLYAEHDLAGKEKNTHQSHEFRLSTPDDWRVRAIGGVYWEEYKIYDDTDWLYKTVPTCTPSFDTNCFNNVQPWPGVPANNPNERNDNVAFFDDVVRSIYQKAAFGSVDVDIIPKTLTFTAGTRYYKFNEDERGGDVGSFYCKVYSTPTTYFGPCLNPYGTNLDTQNPNSSKYSGFRSRANLSWKVTDDLLLYYTWSQGFRPGGFNRGVSGHLPVNGVDQYYTPATYAPDTLTNNEIGWKSEWLGHRLQFNGAVYQEDWKNALVSFFDPQGGFGNLTFSTNGPDYRVRGVEIQFVTRITEGLTIQGSASWNSTQPDQLALPDQQQPAECDLRKADHLGGQSLRSPGRPPGEVTAFSSEPTRPVRVCHCRLQSIRADRR